MIVLVYASRVADSHSGYAMRRSNRNQWGDLRVDCRTVYRLAVTSASHVIAESTAPLYSAAPMTHERRRLSDSTARSSRAILPGCPFPTSEINPWGNQDSTRLSRTAPDY
jgi:hypothetical protein